MYVVNRKKRHVIMIGQLIVTLLICAIIMVSLVSPAQADPLDEGNRMLEERADAFVSEKGPAETFAYGPLSDDDDNRSLFRIPGLISDVTGLNFVPLATIQHLGGDIALYGAVSNLPGDLPGINDALSILARRQLIYFERDYYESYFGEVGEDLLGFSIMITREVWAAFEAEYGGLTVNDTDALMKKYPIAEKVVKLTGLEIEPVSGIRVMAGLDGLLKLMILLPEELPGKDKAIKEVNKARNKTM